MPRLSSRTAVEVGQRYRQVAGGSGVWIVAGFAKDHAGNPHAQLTREGDPTRIATIALAALQDRKLYRRLPENAPAEGKPDDEASAPTGPRQGGAA